MKLFQWLLFMGILSCTKANPEPDVQFNASAVLNGKKWGGITTIWRPNLSLEPCAVNTISLSIENKQPYPRKARLKETSLCGGYCGDQVLSFSRVPLAIGEYPLSTIQPCPAGANPPGVGFKTLTGGDVLLDQYVPDQANPGTIRITKYDSQRGAIEGAFTVVLVRDKSRTNTNDAAETLIFHNGSFAAKLP